MRLLLDLALMDGTSAQPDAAFGLRAQSFKQRMTTTIDTAEMTELVMLEASPLVS